MIVGTIRGSADAALSGPFSPQTGDFPAVPQTARKPLYASMPDRIRRKRFAFPLLFVILLHHGSRIMSTRFLHRLRPVRGRNRPASAHALPPMRPARKPRILRDFTPWPSMLYIIHILELFFRCLLHGADAIYSVKFW